MFSAQVWSVLLTVLLFIVFNMGQVLTHAVVGLFSLFLQFLRKEIAKQVSNRVRLFLCLHDPIDGFHFF